MTFLEFTVEEGCIDFMEIFDGTYSKGVYPQSDGSLAIVDINASKRFVDLWVHLTFAIFATKRQLKSLEMACDQIQTCLIFPLRWAG